MSTPPTDPAGIEREISERQAHLAATVDELTSRVAPKTLAKNGVATVQAKARAAVFDETGNLRVERVAVAGGAVVAVGGLLGFLTWRRRKKK